MKKIFKLQQENKNPDRLLEAVKYEIRKYLKRERKKKLPEDAAFWDFDCRFGQNSDETQSVSASGIITALDDAKNAGWPHCYIEIIAKAAYKVKAESTEADSEEQDLCEPSSSEEIQRKDSPL